MYIIPPEKQLKELYNLASICKFYCRPIDRLNNFMIVFDISRGQDVIAYIYNIRYIYNNGKKYVVMQKKIQCGRIIWSLLKIGIFNHQGPSHLRTLILYLWFYCSKILSIPYLLLNLHLEPIYHHVLTGIRG